ncbi:MAG: hypothetical protein KF775_05890 [Cyclobacteriaceae bacterium]|nr:hypothetical protein [Cyclobacteriaceae bacterium]
MKRTMVLVAGMMAGAVVFAQERHGEHGGHHSKQNLKEVLMLDEAQEATIRSLNKKYAAEFAAIRHDSAQTREQKREELGKLREKREKEINAVLTPEQKAKRKAQMESRKAKGNARTQKIREMHQKERAELGLSAEQETQLKQARKKFASERAALNRKSKAEYKKLETEYNRQLKSFLSEDQLKKLEMKKERRSKSNRKNR